ncbi:hypothetical protein NKH52_30715 [Mesorhizobium sp. M1066]|uniref:hypothetical protein n=1 Tax=unclassified Mesorhizobium TaxID=325217 RepID=UPI00333DFA3F
MGWPEPVFVPSAPSYFETERTAIRMEKPADVSIPSGFSPITSGAMVGPWSIHLWDFLPRRHPTTRHFPRPCGFLCGGHHRPDRRRRPFFAPALVKPRWPWAVTPFNARFLGGFYTAEMVVMAALLVWNRWSPGRLVLVMAFIFTVIVSAASFINLGYFNFERKAPWLWFLVYLASVAVSGLFLWRARARPSAKGVTLNSAWRGYMSMEMAILGLYGVGLLLFPLTFGGFWPWRHRDAPDRLDGDGDIVLARPLRRLPVLQRAIGIIGCGDGWIFR